LNRKTTTAANTQALSWQPATNGDTILTEIPPAANNAPFHYHRNIRNNPTTENDDFLRIIIKYNRIISYHFVFAVSNRNRIQLKKGYKWIQYVSFEHEIEKQGSGRNVSYTIK
jgi:hypothetical protein